ncbi:hypothetical protein [Microbacterium candidum]|uniref:Uncharacterized protein n=1 Tax=Microbacterium candidum TaxID=3041922 RepID=A0ABT7N201_9MICO|nr:hypothetical protein [Microbacterium sp. ASV49]MDL9980736.1 hypothetical protein [Microbacterium sp. ASV49]
MTLIPPLDDDKPGSASKKMPTLAPDRVDIDAHFDKVEEVAEKPAEPA